MAGLVMGSFLNDLTKLGPSILQFPQVDKAQKALCCNLCPPVLVQLVLLHDFFSLCKIWELCYLALQPCKDLQLLPSHSSYN